MAASSSTRLSPDLPLRISLTPEQVKECKEALATFKKKEEEMIAKEFKQLEKNEIAEEDMMERCSVARNKANVRKNRYEDNLPFDDSRIVLQSSENDGVASGYINASPITICSGGETVSKFIATQAPLKHITRTDFWEMVIQNRCPAIVALTPLSEEDDDSEKVIETCADYFQADDETLEFGSIYVEQEGKEIIQNSLVLRHLKVRRKKGRALSVLHFHYTAWLVNRLPENTVAVRAILKRLYHLPPKHGPIVVHCGSGAGRTGAYCAIHNTIQRILAGEKSALNLHDTISVFRLQRYGMIKRQEYYEFCYKAIIKELQDLVS